MRLTVIVVEKPLHRFAVPLPFQGRQDTVPPQRQAPLKGELADAVSRKADD
ncbi:MAG: hypothetical protein J5633_05850 [Oscillospiraceae bacterium]|nr:hypothetical protein [Oscillospiraceae bacterium]